jgi:uncharacterized protein (DUF58 family)
MNPLRRILYLLYRVFTGLWYWMSRRFTRPGLAVLVVFFGLMPIVFDMESTVSYQAFALLTFLLVVSICFGWAFRVKITATRQLPKFGTVGKKFDYTIKLTNRSARIQRGLILLDDLADPRPAFGEWRDAQISEEKMVRSLRLSRSRQINPYKVATVEVVALPPLQNSRETSVRVQATPLRRGVLRYRGVTLARPDPLGLFRALSSFALPQTMLILPKRYPVPPVAFPGSLRYQDGGVALASSVGRNEEFVSLRDYRRGDPPRHIHWRSWAKTGKPIVKEFADEFFVRHALVLDTFSEHPHSEIFEEAVSVAASFACTIQTQESLLDLLFVGAQAYCFTAGRGLAHTDQILEILASVRVCPGKPFEDLETLVLNHSSDVSGCVCVLMAWDAPRQQFVEKLKAAGVPLLVAVVLPATPEVPLDPGPMADSPQNFHVLVAGQVERGLARL